MEEQNGYAGIASGGLGFGSTLTILFIALKLTNIINWSWWLVLLPLGIVPIILIVVFIIILFIACSCASIEKHKQNKLNYKL